MKSKLSEEEIVKMYLDGYGMSKIQKRAGLWNYMQTIRPILVKHGVKIRPPSFSVKRQSNFHAINIDFFKNIDSAEKAYWLGFLYADGCVRKDKVTLTLKDTDIESIVNLKKAIASSHKICKYSFFDKRTGQIYKRASIQICSHEFAKPLIERGVFHNASKNYLFPKDLPKELVFHFIRGLFDGDGSLSLRSGGLKRISLIASTNIINYIQELLFKEYGVEKLRIQKVTENNKDICKMLLYKDAIKFLDLMYKDSTKETRMKRKYERYVS